MNLNISALWFMLKIPEIYCNHLIDKIHGLNCKRKNQLNDFFLCRIQSSIRNIDETIVSEI